MKFRILSICLFLLVPFSSALGATPSLNGSNIPTLTSIIDASSNVWTVTSGVVYENGKTAGFTAGVKLLLYFNGTIYQENTANLWWSYTAGAWVAVATGDPRTPSANAINIPLQPYFIDSSLNVWVISGGVVYENGKTAGYTANAKLLLYFNGTIYHENTAGLWYAFNGTAWVAQTAGDPRVISASGANIPASPYLVDSAHNVWSVVGGQTVENGILQTSTRNVIVLLYYDGVIYQENTSAIWYSFNGSAWSALANDPRWNLTWAGIQARNQACMPFGIQSPTTYEASTHKVFAHYMMSNCCFPLSIDNNTINNPSEYYTNGYLNPDGESGKHVAYGGYLRSRPLPVPSSAPAAFFQNNYETEVMLALAIGIDGFSVDIQGIGQLSELQTMLAAIKSVNTATGAHFTLLPVIDASAMSKDATFSQDVVTILKTLMIDPNIMRLSNGRLVVSAFYADEFPAAIWSSIFTTVQAADEARAPAFIPIFLSMVAYSAANGTSGSFDKISYMISSWGDRTPNGAAGMESTPATMHAKNLGFMMPVAPQDFRPKDLWYDESQNSLTYRNAWNSAISGDADWVQLVTWNDYSEHTHVEPAFGTQYGFYDLAAYFISLYKGFPTYIGRDSVQLFYRNQIAGTGAPKFNTNAQTSPIVLNVSDSGTKDFVEAVVFTDSNDFKAGYSPHVIITVGGVSTSFNITSAGLTSYSVPITMPASGNANVSANLVVNSATTVSVNSPTPINSSIIVQNLLYQSFSATVGSGGSAPMSCGYPQQAAYQTLINGIYSTAAAK